jgi:hypothetical protein
MIVPISHRTGRRSFSPGRWAATKTFGALEPKGLNLHQLSQAPEWYAATKDSPLFTNLEQENEPGPNPDAPSDE